MNSDGPQIISDFYLAALLDSIKQNGYMIFTVEGNLPNHSPSLFRDSLKKTQFYFTVEQIKKNNDRRNKENNNEINLAGYDKREMNKMLEKARREEAAQFGYNYEPKDGGVGPKTQQAPSENKFFEGKGTSIATHHVGQTS